jgi:hypothetical protein
LIHWPSYTCHYSQAISVLLLFATRLHYYPSLTASIVLQLQFNMLLLNVLKHGNYIRTANLSSASCLGMQGWGLKKLFEDSTFHFHVLGWQPRRRTDNWWWISANWRQLIACELHWIL